METRSNSEKNKNTKKAVTYTIGCLGIPLILLTIFVISVFGGSGSDSKQDYNESNTKVTEAKGEKGRASVIAENKIKQLYNIDNFKVKYMDSNFKVTRMPDDKNSETGEVYKNVYSVRGDYTWQDRIYHFSMLYSMKNEDQHTVLMLNSNMDASKTINVPLESDK